MAEKIDSIRVDGTDYTFTLSSNSSLTISGLTVTGSITTDTIKADTANLAVIKITTSFPAGSSIPDRTVSIDTDGIFSSDNYEIEVVNEDSTITLSANKIKLTTQSNACDLIFDTGTGFSTPTILMSCNSNLLISTNSDSIFIDGNSLRSPSKGYIEIQDLVPIKSISSAYADFGTTSKWWNNGYIDNITTGHEIKIATYSAGGKGSMSTPYTLSFPNDAGRLARVEDIPFKAERVKNLIGDNVIVNIGGVQADLFLDGYGHYWAKYYSEEQGIPHTRRKVWSAVSEQEESDPTYTTVSIKFLETYDYVENKELNSPVYQVVIHRYLTAEGPFGDMRKNPLNGKDSLEPFSYTRVLD